MPIDCKSSLGKPNRKKIVLSRAQRRARGDGSGAQVVAWHEWRRHMAERFAAGWAVLGADEFGAEPAAAFFTA